MDWSPLWIVIVILITIMIVSLLFRVKRDIGSSQCHAKNKNPEQSSEGTESDDSVKNFYRSENDESMEPNRETMTKINSLKARKVILQENLAKLSDADSAKRNIIKTEFQSLNGAISDLYKSYIDIDSSVLSKLLGISDSIIYKINRMQNSDTSKELMDDAVNKLNLIKNKISLITQE